MGLPSKVKEQGDLSDRLAEQHFGNKDKGASPQPAAPAAERGTGAEDWEKRFKGLKQTHDTTVRNLRNTIDDLETKVNRLTEQLNATPPEPVQPKKITVEDVKGVLTDAEQSQYTPEFIDLVARIASAATVGGTDTSNLDSRVKNLEQERAQSKSEKFWNAIKSAYPDWKELQETEEMAGWLLETDPILGMTRNDRIVQAQQSLDPEPIIAIFNQYVREFKPARTAAFVATEVGEDELILPGGDGGQGDDPGQPEGKIWTVSAINQFYQDWASSDKYKGEEGRKEALAIEKDIQKARDDGRVRNG